MESIVKKEETNTAQILKAYWPLAASWLLMGFEGPMISAVIARLANPEINLAAYGGVVFPIAIAIEAPIIMLLAASTALCKDWRSYLRIRRFMIIAGALLTALHLLITLTPLYYFIVRQIIGVPEEIIAPARVGLIFLTPWTWSIAYRKFQQGIMIRFGYSKAVGVGTIVRLTGLGVFLLIGYVINNISGIIVAAFAQAMGVICEATYAGWVVRPVVRNQVKNAPAIPLIPWKSFFKFYIPLALTSFLSLFWQPIGSAALSRMSQPISSLAVWPVLSGSLFMLRSFGIAFNEVALSYLDRQGATIHLRNITKALAAATTALHLIIAITPLSWLWFSHVSALSPQLSQLADSGFWFVFPLPAMSVLQSWYQGAILYSRKTGAVIESMAIFFVTVVIILGIGVRLNQFPGVFVAMFGMSLASLAQVTWLWVRSRKIMSDLNARDGIKSASSLMTSIPK